MPNRENKRRVGLLITLITLVLVALGLAYHAHLQKTASDREEPQTSLMDGNYSSLAGTLDRLDAALKTGMNPEQMLQFASDIHSQVAAHPLPEDDDLQLGVEIVMRYLRELAALESYRRLKIVKNGFDPLDPRGPHPNTEKIELREKYSTWLRKRTSELRDKLKRLESGR